MADTECDLDQLTAFLEDSDNEGDETSTDKPINKDKQEGDECSQEEIEAFLEGSEDEEEEGVKTNTMTTGSQKDKTADDDFEDYTCEEINELANLLENDETGPDTEENKTSSTGANIETSCNVHMSSDNPSDIRNEEINPPAPQSVEDQLRAEMALMQKRMLELQNMLSSQKSHTDNNKTCQQKSTSPTLKGTMSVSKDKPLIGKKDNQQSISKQKTCSNNKSLQKTGKVKDSRLHLPGSDGKSAVKKLPRDKIKTSSPPSSRERKGAHKEAINPFFSEVKTSQVNKQDNTQVNIQVNSKGHVTAVDAKSLFGVSDDDSDWDELDGEDTSKLSKEGKDIKNLLNSGPRQREAHAAKYDTQVLKKSSPPSGNGNRWLDKPGGCTTSRNFENEKNERKSKCTLKEEYQTRPAPNVTSTVTHTDQECVSDPYCGIKIVNPKISMPTFKAKMSDRTLVKVSRIASKSCPADLLKGNWVTLGVVVHRTEPRQSTAGKAYSIWKLSDLIDCDKTITFFLFGNIYKEHWKNDIGTVVGLLNPTLMDKAEKVQSEAAFTINHPQQLLVMGISKDLGRCRGTTKAGNACSSFINKAQGEFCTYHVQAAYRKLSSQRIELQTSTGVEPKAFKQQKLKGGAGCYFYGGQTYSTLLPKAKSSKDDVTLKKLKNQAATKGVAKVTTMSLHELEPEAEAKLEKLQTDKDKGLLDLLSVPTPGSMNFVKHLVKKETTKENDSDEKVQIQSISAKDLLKEHQKKLKEKMQARKAPNPLSVVPTLGRGLQPGMDICLGSSAKKSKMSTSEQAKRLAINKIQTKGGVRKQDPNAVRKKVASPEMKEKIKKRVAEDMDVNDKMDQGETGEPPKKRSKLLGNIDLNSPEVQKLLKVKSKHTGALAEAEAEHEERYFMELEKKERVEDKMSTIMEVAVTAVQCLQCKYSAFSLADRCKTENHPTKRIKASKRFFKCKSCKRRTVSLDKIETRPCKNCGSSSFERTSMLKEKSGPKLESEELCLRGNEQKFLNSISQKSFLSA